MEVLGWAEPGTKIVINGKELPVSNQGLFLEQFIMTENDNFIRVEATSANGSKVITRKFKVE